MTGNSVKCRELVNIMTKYTEALIEKNPSALPLADNCRATYNGMEIHPGENEVWKNTLVIRERQTFVDPVSGEAVFFGMMTNETIDRNQDFKIDFPVYVIYYQYTVRIKVENHEITEIEELACDRRIRNFYNEIHDIKLPDLEFEIPVPEEERSTRMELIEIVETYWDACEQEEARKKLPVHPDAQRIENGYRTTNHSYSFLGDFKHNPGFRWKTPKNTRSYPVADPVRGLVVSECLLQDNKEAPDGCRGKMIVEAFKIKDGAICHVMAHFPRIAGTMGWEK